MKNGRVALYIFGIGSLLTGLVGVLDERINIRPIYQLATQFISAFYIYRLNIRGIYEKRFVTRVLCKILFD